METFVGGALTESRLGRSPVRGVLFVEEMRVECVFEHLHDSMSIDLDGHRFGHRVATTPDAGQVAPEFLDERDELRGLLLLYEVKLEVELGARLGVGGLAILPREDNERHEQAHHAGNVREPSKGVGVEGDVVREREAGVSRQLVSRSITR